MIPVSSASVEPKAFVSEEKAPISWQKQLTNGFRNSHDLLRFLNIDPIALHDKVLNEHDFPVRVPVFFAKLMKQGDIHDPLLRQVLALKVEHQTLQDFHSDPLDEESFSASKGLIHKYKNRVLLIAHQSCAIHCRYCFRRHFPYAEQRLSNSHLIAAIDYIKQDTAIEEVILSGGDPLNLADAKITELITLLDTIDHATTLRLHTRTAVVLPDRITPELIQTLRKSRKNVVIVFHINHANEISEHFAEQIKPLKNAGVTLLNQSVLLKGVNDDSRVLIELSRKLWAVGILPYYLHQLDSVAGAAHFQVEPTAAENLWRALQSEVSGYLLPRLVQEIPHKTSKTWINPINNC